MWKTIFTFIKVHVYIVLQVNNKYKFYNENQWIPCPSLSPFSLAISLTFLGSSFGTDLHIFISIPSQLL